MAKLIYSAITSLDGYVEDMDGKFDWATLDQLRQSSTAPPRERGRAVSGEWPSDHGATSLRDRAAYLVGTGEPPAPREQHVPRRRLCQL